MRMLEVAIVTIGRHGMERLAASRLPEVTGVGYVVSWQTAGTEPIVPPALLERPDVEVVITDTVGASINRNNALDRCSAPLILMADDDLEFSAEGLRGVIGAFEAHEDIDFAVFAYSGADHPRYPIAEVPLPPVPSGFPVATFTIAVRRSVTGRGVRFDERFGPGSRLPLGEDEMLFHTLLRRGFKGRFFPMVIVRHAGLTSGYRPVDAPSARALGAIIGMVYPLTSLLRIPLKAWRMGRSGQMPALPALAALTRGWLTQLIMTRPWHN